MVEVTPGGGPAGAHPVYRYGYALALGASLAAADQSRAADAVEGSATAVVSPRAPQVTVAATPVEPRAAPPGPQTARRVVMPQRQYPPSSSGKKQKRRR